MSYYGKEADEKRKKQEEEMHCQVAEGAELRTAMSFNPANDDWRVAREDLLESEKFPTSLPHTYLT